MRAGIYARVSSGSDEQANALEQQLDRLHAAAAQQGDPDPLRYIDIDSGTKDDRPELARLLADCRGGLISTLIITRLDRLSRSSIHGAQLLRWFSSDAWPNLLALDDSLDLSTPGGRFMARMLISWAEAESDRLAERTRHGFAHRRKLRKPFGSKPLFSYVFSEDGSRLEPDPDRWHIAQEAVERFLKEPVTGVLLDWFNDEHGISWGSAFSLRRWLCNPTIAGARVYGGQIIEQDSETGKKRRRDRPPGQFGEIHWTDDNGLPFQPPLVTQEQLAFIHSIYAARAETSQRDLRDGEARILTGLVTCGECGRNLHHHTPGKGADYWCLRCITVGCGRRYKTLRASGVAEGMLVALQLHARELMLHLDEIERAQTDEMSPAETELRDRIHRLEAMNDPDLQEVLDKKRAELAVMLQQDRSGEVESFLEAADALRGLNVGELVRDEPELVRNLLQRYVRGESNTNGPGELALVYVAEAIRRPGKNRAICIEGMGVGRRPKQQIKMTLAWLKNQKSVRPD